MKTFRIRAIDKKGEIIECFVDAENTDSVTLKIQSDGLLPIRISESKTGNSTTTFTIFDNTRLSHKNLASIFQQLSTLISAGLTLDRSLSIISSSEDQPVIKAALEDIHNSVKEGNTFSSVLNKRHDIPPIVTGMVRAAEASGELTIALDSLADYFERSITLQEHVKSTLIYPVILVCVSVLSIFVLLVFVIPHFAQIFHDGGQQLPLPTRIVITAGEILINYWWLIIIGIIFLIYFIKGQLKKTHIKRHVDQYLLKIPIVNELILKLNIARFTNTLGVLLNSGVNVLSALDISNSTVTNAIISEGIDQARDDIKAGKRMGASLLSVEQFPLLAAQMISVGEETGALGKTLFHISKTYERETKASITRLLSLLEPLLILGLGLLIGGIVMSILIAILEINQLVI